MDRRERDGPLFATETQRRRDGGERRNELNREGAKDAKTKRSQGAERPQQRPQEAQRMPSRPLLWILGDGRMLRCAAAPLGITDSRLHLAT